MVDQVYTTNHPNHPPNEYDILSSFAATPIQFNDLTFATAEHLFQYLKFPTKDATYDWYLMLIVDASTPFEATVLGTQRKHQRAPHLDKVIDLSHKQKLRIRKNFKAVKELKRAIDLKFEQSEAYRAALYSTIGGVIVNLIAHPFWGVGKVGMGENAYGKMLMMQRETNFAARAPEPSAEAPEPEEDPIATGLDEMLRSGDPKVARFGETVGSATVNGSTPVNDVFRNEALATITEPLVPRGAVGGATLTRPLSPQPTLPRPTTYAACFNK